jgi:hypothetical protein
MSANVLYESSNKKLLTIYIYCYKKNVYSKINKNYYVII